MDPSEIEFLAEHEQIKIVPNFSEGILYLLEGEVGPFRAGLPIEVPLWVAVNLRQRQKCRILQPEWMQVDILEQVKESERESQFFTPLPNPHLFVVAQALLDPGFIVDISHADKIKTLVKDVWDIRQAKLRKSVDAFVQSGLQHAKLDHLQTIELQTVRPLLPHTLDHVHRLEKAGAATRRAAGSTISTSATSGGRGAFSSSSMDLSTSRNFLNSSSNVNY